MLLIVVQIINYEFAQDQLAVFIYTLVNEVNCNWSRGGAVGERRRGRGMGGGWQGTKGCGAVAARLTWLQNKKE